MPHSQPVIDRCELQVIVQFPVYFPGFMGRKYSLFVSAQTNFNIALGGIGHCKIFLRSILPLQFLQ